MNLETNIERNLEDDRKNTIISCLRDWPLDSDSILDDRFNRSVHGIILYWIYKFRI